MSIISDLFNKTPMEIKEHHEQEQEELQTIFETIPIGETDYYLMEVYHEWEDEDDEEEVLKRWGVVDYEKM